ncbi:hypothetical protein SDRG_04109 [Saprolegnia diclina VS20]|uniref:Uncharacterized protein n=1 Tax=Saprolegnia diclina (strain VS20) TaxID=1156394 RepID=T0S0E6_SAPDV|nr:hypothetical protein SDRG_04109 [Saprolegnia diclina VS20]EQC38398.1 hypothetical protein SDRG_04109 [Saprolegnia diclina VS20]|eukprot:XP_008607990.1 hypothetical protein SDRG_04109 [Saprolegnia diclina VS20]
MALDWPAVQARASDDAIVLLDQSSGAMVVLTMTVVVGNVGFEVSCAHTTAPVAASRAAMLDFDDADEDDETAAQERDGVASLPMALQLHVQASSSKRRKTVSKVVESITKKLQTLNKDLASLSLATDFVVNGDVASDGARALARLPSRACCMDAVWLTLRSYGDVLMVVLDFEGLGSFERSMQEDTLLSALNVAISQRTIDAIGQLNMNAKDINPNEAESVIDEFKTKLKSPLRTPRPTTLSLSCTSTA